LKTYFSSFSTLIIFCVLTVIGFALTPLLPVQFLPSAQSSSISVQFSWGETAPEIIEQQIVTPLEGALNLIQGIQKITSISQKGSGRIQLELDKKIELDFLRFEVANKIRQLYSSFPEGVTYPQVRINNVEKKAEQRPILVYSLSGETPPSELFRYANEVLSPQLAVTEGLQSVQVEGGNEMEWRITYDAALMQMLGVEVKDIRKSIQDLFQTQALGIAQEGTQTIFVNLKNNWINESSEHIEWKTIPILRDSVKTIYLGDIAIIHLAEQVPQQYYRINGKNSIRLFFFPEKNTNHIELAKK